MAFNERFVLSKLCHLTHQRTGFQGAMLEPVVLESGCLLDNGRHDKQGTATLGVLEALPVELIQMILLDLDLQSLTSLRRVNRRTRLTVDSLWQYKEIIIQAPNCLRAALSINVSSSISCRQLHTELCSQKCVACGRFGAYLYLLTCSRVCYVCLIEDPQFLPLTPKHARRAFGLNSHETGLLLTANTLPGKYSHNSKMERRRIALVDRTSSRLAGIKFHKSVEQMEAYVSQLHAKEVSSYEAKVQSNRTSNSRMPPRPAYTEVHDRQGGNPHRFMCVVRIPWLDRSGGKIEWGLSCIGCRDKFHDRTEGKLDWRWLYTTSGYLEHVVQCEESIEILESLA